MTPALVPTLTPLPPSSQANEGESGDSPASAVREGLSSTRPRAKPQTLPPSDSPSFASGQGTHEGEEGGRGVRV